MVHRCSQNTYVVLNGSSAGDHRSLMFHSFNLYQWWSDGGDVTLPPPADVLGPILPPQPQPEAAFFCPLSQLFHRSPMTSSCAPHVSEQTSGWGAKEAPAPLFHGAYCGFPASLPALCRPFWELCLFSFMGSLQMLLPSDKEFHQKDRLVSLTVSGHL